MAIIGCFQAFLLDLGAVNTVSRALCTIHHPPIGFAYRVVAHPRSRPARSRATKPETRPFKLRLAGVSAAAVARTTDQMPIRADPHHAESDGDVAGQPGSCESMTLWKQLAMTFLDDDLIIAFVSGIIAFVSGL